MKFPKSLIIPLIALCVFIVIFVTIVDFKPRHLIGIVFAAGIIYVTNNTNFFYNHDRDKDK